MTEGKFEKVQYTDKRLYGPQKFVLCGFSAAAQPMFGNVLAKAGLDGVGVVWADDTLTEKTLSELHELPDNTGAGTESTLPRAIIVSGITENQLHSLMAICRQSGMKNALWAALTPTSETWQLVQLLNELKAEQVALSKQRKR